MTIADIHQKSGMECALIFHGEKITVGVWTVAAIVDRQPRTLDMLDAGYLNRSPLAIQCLKGTPESTAKIFAGGELINKDLRANVPAINTTATVDSIVRKIVQIEDGASFWTLTCIKQN